jgi:hypothetical protein
MFPVFPISQMELILTIFILNKNNYHKNITFFELCIVNSTLVPFGNKTLNIHTFRTTTYNHRQLPQISSF